VVQTIFIISGFIFTAISYRKEIASRKVYTLIQLSQIKKEIWDEFIDNPSLHRINQRDVDLEKHPITIEERYHVKQHILQMYSVFLANKYEQIELPEEFLLDMKDFLSFTIPNKIWQSISPYQAKGFIQFIDQLRIYANKN
ncbi:MAG: hypothetical protein AAF598_12510, partial [Bacteroidota bacterium]